MTRVTRWNRTSTPALLSLGLVSSLFALGPTTATAAQQAPWPTEEWATSSPEAQGLAGTLFVELDRTIEDGTYGHIDRMVVVKNGYLVVNERYEHDYRAASRGRDMSPHQYNYYHPDWHPYFQGRDVHSLQSVTKSVTSALIGIAIGRGEIDGTGVRLLSFFGDYDLSRVDRRLRDATLDDLLTMRSGIEWHETDRPMNSTNTTIQLEASEDWIQFTLDQPMDADPGTKWVYNSGGSHLMSGVIKEATGLYVDEYAEAHLFSLLGIQDYHWKKTPKGLPDTEGGLYLEAEQLAKFGYLYLNDGVWDGRRILPEGWTEASTDRRVERVGRSGRGYGYQWWRLDRRDTEVWAGLGYGGQYLLVLPEQDLVGVINSWNLFGAAQSQVLGPFLDALIASAGF